MPKICLLSLCSRLISDESSIDSYSSSWTDLSLGLHFPFKSLTSLHANNTNVSIMVEIRSREETTCFILVISLVSSAFNNGITAMTARIVRYTDSNALTLFFLYGCNVLWMARISEQIINRMTWKNRRKLYEINVFNVALLDSAHVKCDVWTGPQSYVFPGALALHYQLAIGLECWYQLEGFFRLLYSTCVVLWAGSDCVFSLFWHYLCTFEYKNFLSAIASELCAFTRLNRSPALPY